LTGPRPWGRFERHPRLTGAGLLAGALLLVELALRLLAPAPLRFAHEMRRVHGYSRSARVDLRASRSARLRMPRADGQPLFDFRLITSPQAFRIEETALPPPSPAGRLVHAIGDSYTMGWGVDASDSWPARLARRLAPELQVLNLAVDGFGAIGATGKSRELAGRFPPAQAVYLFSPNDLEDDERAAAVARRSDLVHAAHEALDALRRHSYLAAVPFAIRYRLRFREGAAGNGLEADRAGAGRAGTSRAAADKPGMSQTEAERLDPKQLLLPEPAALPEPPGHHPTFIALAAYRDFLAARRARLLVLVLSTQPESLRALRFCRENGIDAHLFEAPPSLRIPDEGHFNPAGNEAVAALVERLLREGRDAAGS
jgi:lysophospholipase L1-like esterase